MTDTDHALEAIARAATELVPQLAERLERHGLGEIEVVRGELRLRVAASGSRQATERVQPPVQDSTGPEREVPSSSAPAVDPSSPPTTTGVASPAVGFFVYADGLGPGLGVAKGDPLGHVEMLGVHHDVRAPRGGTVRNLVAESGEAVEYGQVVLEIEPAEGAR